MTRADLAWRRTSGALELAVLALVMIEFARVVIGLIALDAPLHWDEAVYAVRARSWVDSDAPLSGWSYIRPPLLPVIAGVPVLAGGDEWQLRIIGLVSGVGLLVAAWWLGRMVAGPIAGLLAAAVLQGSPTLQKESATLLTDVPATALLVASAALAWWQLEARPRPGAGLVVAVAVAVLAFLMRYGSLLVLAPLAAVALALWWPVLWAHRRVTMAALAIGVVAIVGHLAWSVLQTGSPIGILIDAQDVVPPDPAGTPPLRDYRAFREFTLAGSVGAVAMQLGIETLAAAALAVALLPKSGRWLRASLFLVLPALAQIFLLTRGVGHAEERFFLYSTVALVVAGTAFVGVLLRLVPSIARAALLGVIGVTIVLTSGEAIDHAGARTIETARYYRQFEVVGEAIGEVAGDECGIVGGGYPIMAWYSGCRTAAFDGAPGSNLDASERWAVLYGDPDEVDMTAPIPAAILENAEGEPMRIADPQTGREIATAWRLRRP